MHARSTVGREWELDVLAEVLDTAARGRGSLVWIDGAPGLGKSHLLDIAREDCRSRGLQTFAAEARELDVHRPFGLLLDAFGVRGVPGEPGLSAYGITEALIARMAAACETTPLLLTVDDVQWADEASLDFLDRFLTEFADLPVAVMIASRPTSSPALQRLVARVAPAGGRRLRLEPLSPASAHELGASLLDGSSGVAAYRSLIDRCGGNPLLIRAALSTADGAGEADSTGPLALHRTVLEWLGHVDPGTREVLGVASVFGSSFTASEVAALTGRGTAELWPALRQALELGALQDGGEALLFAHDVVRESLYEQLPLSVRRGLHLDVARALHAAAGPISRVAEHALRGASVGDDLAVSWLREAAEAAAPRSPGTAADLLAVALNLLPDHAPARPQLELELVRAEVASGRLEQAEGRVVAILAETADAGLEVALRLCLVDVLMRRGQYLASFEQAQLVAGLPGVAAGDRARALIWLTIGPLFAHDVPALRAAAQMAMAAAEVSGEVPGVLAHAYVSLAEADWFAGDFAAAVANGRESVRIAVASGVAEAHISTPHLNQSMMLVDVDDLEGAAAAVAAARRTYSRLGMDSAVSTTTVFAGNVAFAAGGWDDALAELETASSAAARLGAGWRADCLAVLALMRVRRGEVGAARALRQQLGVQLAGGVPLFKLGWDAWVDALLLEADGDLAGAAQRQLQAVRTVLGAPMLGELHWLAPDLLRLVPAVMTRPDVEPVAAALVELARRNPAVGSLRALARYARAVVEDDLDGRVAAAADDQHPMVLQAGLTHEAAALGLAAAGRLDAAQAHAARALTLFEGLGGVQDVRRLRSGLRQLGLRRGGARRRGEDVLTPTEARVAALVAEGLSNPEIAARLVISRHTVATHVSHMLGKLGLRTRVELAGWSVRHPTGGR